MSRYILYKKEPRMPYAFIDCTNNVDMKLYMVTGVDGSDTGIASYDFVADICAKRDACTHWNFYGQDYDGSDENKDSYYHICGPYILKRMILCMIFAWEVSRRVLIHENRYEPDNFIDYIKSWYDEDDEINNMIKRMLREYDIEETEITELENFKI